MVGSIPTLVRVFLCPCVGPVPSVGLTLTWFIWDRNLALHVTLHSLQLILFKIKGLVASPNSLQYLDNFKSVTIQVDASQRGLGAALIQDKGPVECRSKLLTETETRYSNIEREMLAVVHGLEKFHYYAYGRHVVVESDHKPLKAIFKKPLSNSPPRIARMLLRIQKCDVEITYVPGKNIPLADALSRLSPCVGEKIADIDIQVHELP